MTSTGCFPRVIGERSPVTFGDTRKRTSCFRQQALVCKSRTYFTCHRILNCDVVWMSFFRVEKEIHLPEGAGGSVCGACGIALFCAVKMHHHRRHRQQQHRESNGPTMEKLAAWRFRTSEAKK